MGSNEYLNKLRRESGALDFTGPNVQKSLSDKEKKRLEPELQNALPRRRRGEESSSYYRCLRTKFLSRNPYLRRDVADVRRLLNIPAGQIAKIDLRPFPHRTGLWKECRELTVSEAASFWLYLHRRVGTGGQPDILMPPLPDWFTRSATGWPKATAEAGIPWLAAAGTSTGVAPVDRYAVRLAQRYRLPRLAAGAILSFILTLDPKHISDIPPMDVGIDVVDRDVGRALQVTVDWIDEYTTMLMWQDVFKRFVRPRQRMLLEERGDRAHSKRVELEELGAPWLLALLDWQIEHPKAGIDASLEQLSKQGMLPQDGLDPKNARQQLAKLRAIMAPRD